MTQTGHIDKDVYSSDEKKLGKVKKTWAGEPYGVEDVLVIGRTLRNDIFVPASVVTDSGDRLVVRHPEDFIKGGPPLSDDRGASAADMRHLVTYYRGAA